MNIKLAIKVLILGLISAQDLLTPTPPQNPDLNFAEITSMLNKFELFKEVQEA